MTPGDALLGQLDRADELIRLKRDSQAMDLLLGLLRERPDAAARIHLVLARGHLVAHRPEPARDHAAAAVAAAPSSATAHLLLGVAQRASGRLADAETALRTAAALSPAQARVHTVLAQVLRDRGRSMEAYAAAGEALRLAPGDALSHFTMGYVLHDANPAEARRAYEAALALDPHDASARHNLAALAADRGDWHSASTVSADVLASEPDQVMPLILLDQRLVQTVGRTHWVLVAVWFAFGLASGAGVVPALVVAAIAPTLIALMLILGTRPLRQALPGGGTRFLRGFPRREPLAALWLVLLLLVPLPMLAGVLAELSGAAVDGRFLGVSAMGLLILGAVLSWVRVPISRSRTRRLQQRGH